MKRTSSYIITVKNYLQIHFYNIHLFSIVFDFLLIFMFQKNVYKTVFQETQLQPMYFSRMAKKERVKKMQRTCTEANKKLKKFNFMKKLFNGI